MESSVLKPWFRLVAIAEDEATKEFFAIIKYRDVRGGMRCIDRPVADLGNRKALTKTLTNLGAYFSEKEVKNKRALDKLLAAKGKAKRINFARQVGWYGGGYKTYVLANRVIGAPDSIVQIRPPRRLDADGHTAGLGRAGTHDEWCRTVARRARYSSRMVFAISSALAAPLLGMGKLPSFGVPLHGSSKAGKSTLLVAAGSVTGYAREEDLPNFRATDPAFGEIPVSFNDSLLPLNELGLLKGGAAEKCQRLRNLTYGLAEGRGTTYSKFAPVDGRGGSKWRSIALATAEESANEIARDACETRMAGETVRWIDLAATRKGAADIFDLIPKIVPKAERARWAEQQCARIRIGCEANHGVAIVHFIEQVIRNRETVQEDVQTLRQNFADKVVGANDDPVVRHLAKCFGHIYAAGVLGVQFKTLPWSTKTVRKCIVRCYRDARRELNTETDLLRDGLSIMHGKIRGLPVADDADLKTADGFLKGTKPNQAIIRAEAFKSWFPDPRQPNLVLKFLRLKNALRSRGTPKSGIAIVWAESQPEWPDDSRRRSIVIDERPGQLKI